jgi:hypothetical protein
MIITESFVWINFPKTASTFVRECLRELYTIPWWNLAKKNRFKNRWMNELEMPLIFAPGIPRYGSPTPHGVFRQIPLEFQNLPVLSAVRDPVERLVSLYHYGDWKKQDALPRPLDEIRYQYPTFPEIEFEDFYKFMYSEKNYIIVGNKNFFIGPQSHSLLNFFCNKSKIQHDQEIRFESWNQLSNLFKNISFISSKNISEDLCLLLASYSHDIKDLKFIMGKNKINVSIQKKININNETKNKIYSNEWLLNIINENSGNISNNISEKILAKENS